MNIAELNLLRSEDLLSLARNPVATVRKEAIRLLVERGSQYAGHDDVVKEAGQIIYADPRILKTCDPASAVFAQKLPGLLDVIGNEADKTKELQQKARDFDDKHAAHDREDVYLHDFALNLSTVLAGKLDETKSYLLRHDAELFTVTQERIKAAETRLALLERSLWRKFVDWLKRKFKRARST